MAILERFYSALRGRTDEASKPPLTGEQLRDWSRNGFLVLPGLLTREEVETVERVIDDEWARRDGNLHEVDLLTGPSAFRTFKMQDVPDGSRREAYKLNNLFVRRAEIRAIALSRKMKAILAQLLEAEPLICNTLNFERGSQQPYHIDTWYMPPPVDNRMVAAWFAVDDVDATNGPLTYYPGSHLIPAYRFSHGRLNEIREERPRCDAYLESEIAARGLEATEFHGKRGDVFLWHAQLLHGGRPITDMARTRKSMVVHYWRACDVGSGDALDDPASGRYLRRTLRGEIQV